MSYLFKRSFGLISKRNYLIPYPIYCNYSISNDSKIQDERIAHLMTYLKDTYKQAKDKNDANAQYTLATLYLNPIEDELDTENDNKSNDKIEKLALPELGVVQPKENNLNDFNNDISILDIHETKNMLKERNKYLQDIRDIRKEARKKYVDQLKKDEKNHSSIVKHTKSENLQVLFNTNDTLPIHDLLSPFISNNILFNENDYILFDMDENEIEKNDYNKIIPFQANQRKAIAWLRKAADNNLSEAQVHLGNLCLSEKDPILASEAISWYKLAAERDMPHPDALYNLGSIFYEGIHETNHKTGKMKTYINTDKKLGFQYFLKAAERNDSCAQFFLGHLMRIGNDELKLKPDISSSVKMLEASANNDHPPAQYYLAQLYRESDESLPKEEKNKIINNEKFWKYLTLAAKNDEPEALFCLADIYYHGNSDGITEKDINKAIYYYNKAAYYRHENALLCLGTILYNGTGVAQNLEQAFCLYQEAAEAGCMHAWKNLAEMYLTGKGVAKNDRTGNSILKMLKKYEEEKNYII